MHKPGYGTVGNPHVLDERAGAPAPFTGPAFAHARPRMSGIPYGWVRNHSSVWRIPVS